MTPHRSVSLPPSSRSVRRRAPKGRCGDQIERHGGQLLAAGVAAFDGPSRAIRCTEGLRIALKTMGRELHAGMHVGECERHGDRVSGPAVEVARRLGALAAGDEILVTRTVVDLVAGSGLRFDARGETSLDDPTGQIEVCALSAADDG